MVDGSIARVHRPHRRRRAESNPVLSKKKNTTELDSCFLPKRPIQIECSANQGQVSERLGKISQRLAGGTGFLRVKSQMVGGTLLVKESQKANGSKL